MLYIIYSLIGLLFILIHGLLIKYFNLSFIPSEKSLTIENITNKHNTYKLVLKLFFIQSEIFLLSNWLFQNILAQSKLHHKFFNFLPNVNLDNFLVSFSNVFINWVISMILIEINHEICIYASLINSTNWTNLVDGTYYYKIYDNNLNVYSELKYSQIQIENDNLNIEANALFNRFLIDLSIQFTEEEIAQDAMFIPVQKETNSYLKTLVSKE
jgi:hypothetical protein